MAVIAFLELLAGHIGAFFGLELEEAAVHRHFVAHVVEDEELRLGTEERGVADAGALEMGLGMLGDRARVAAVVLAGQRLQHVADDDQRGLRGEGIERRGGEVGQQQHVGLVDRLPAGDRRAVEHDALGQQILVDGLDRLGEVLPFAPRVGEPEVDVFHLMLFDEREDFCSVGHDGFPRCLE